MSRTLFHYITVHIPITLRHQGGRKQIVTPAGATPWISTPRRVDNTLVKAIVRAHRWRDMLESGRHATVRDLAKAEVINESYLGRILRLSCSHRVSSKLSSRADSPLRSSLTVCSSNSRSHATKA
jgi:hypothetical protein